MSDMVYGVVNQLRLKKDVENGSKRAKVALNFADNTDAKMEHITEVLRNNDTDGWMGFDKFLDSNFRKSTANE